MLTEKNYCVNIKLDFCFQNGIDIVLEGNVNLYNLVGMAIISFLYNQSKIPLWFVFMPHLLMPHVIVIFSRNLWKLLSLNPLYIR